MVSYESLPVGCNFRSCGMDSTSTRHPSPDPTSHMDELLDGILSRVSLLRQENAQLKQDLEIHETNITSLETQVADLYPVRWLTDKLSSLLNSL